MPNIPCPTPPVVCPPGTDGDDALIANANVETPDIRMFFGYRFALRSSSFCEGLTQNQADLCALNPPDQFDSDTIYSSAEQTCTLDCGSYTVPSGTSLGFSQAEADAAAYQLACIGASIVCGGGEGTLFPNEAQACSATCQDGTVMTVTVAAGALQAFSQSEANANAYAIACQAAAGQCPNIPPPNFGNIAVTSTTNCSTGGTFTYKVPANTFFASSQAAANATAQSYADQQVVTWGGCMGDLRNGVCQGNSYDEFIFIGDHDLSEFTWSVTSGSLPPGWGLGNGEVYGDASVAGSYTFTIQAVHNPTGNISVRQYTVGIIQITTATPLTAGGASIPYSLALAQTGIASGAVWSVVAGALPAGLSLSSAGVISGTPTTAGSSAFTVAVANPVGIQCTKDFTMTVAALQPMDWWKLNEAGSTNRIGSLNALPLVCTANVTSVAGGKYANATALNSIGTPTFSIATCDNTAVPVPGMAYAGNGIDAFVWIDIPNGSNADTILDLVFLTFGNVEVWSMSFTVDTLIGMTYEIIGLSSGIKAFPVSPNYRLFEIYYDPSTNIMGVRVNNGAAFDDSMSVPSTMGVAGKGSVFLKHARRSAFTAAADCCELTVYPAILTAAQRAYIYNAGAGRTWPVVLP